MAKTKKRETGDIGEGVVVRYVTNKGFSVIEQNYWRPWGEIDIVAEKAGKLRFIEVKTVSRVTKSGLRPEENMHKGKLLRLSRAIQTYLLEKKVGESKEWQIDLACVVLDRETRRAKVELFENIIL
ncbi:MAG: YraN family protein [bacterium]